MGDFETIKPNEFARRIHEHDDDIPRFKMTSAERTAWTNPPEPCFVYETNTGKLYYYGNTEVSGQAPIGSGQLWFTGTAPTGYLICNGSAVSRTTYSDLFAVIGTTWGTGDGSTTFNLPDLRQYVPVGYKSGDADFGTLGAIGGEKTHTLATNEMPAHGHPDNAASGSATLAAGTAWTSPGIGGNTGNTGGGAAHNNLQPFVVVNYIIKY